MFTGFESDSDIFVWLHVEGFEEFAFFGDDRHVEHIFEIDFVESCVGDGAVAESVGSLDKVDGVFDLIETHFAAGLDDFIEGSEVVLMEDVVDCAAWLVMN